MDMNDDQLLTFTLQISAGDDADALEIDRLTRNLLAEIDTQAESTALALARDLPDGAKSALATTIGAIAVGVLPTVLPALIVLIQHWLLRQQNDTIKVKIGDSEIAGPRDMTDAEIARFIKAVKALNTAE